MGEKRTEEEEVELKADRQGLLARAELARSVLDRAIDDLRADRDASWAREYVDTAFRKLFLHEAAHAWMTFARCIENAARGAGTNTSPAADRARARVARASFSGLYADLAVKLDEDKVLAAIVAWRSQKRHWEAVREAVLCFAPAPPTARSMSRQYQAVPRIRT